MTAYRPGLDGTVLEDLFYVLLHVLFYLWSLLIVIIGGARRRRQDRRSAASRRRGRHLEHSADTFVYFDAFSLTDDRR